jgi:hypothetical protein
LNGTVETTVEIVWNRLKNARPGPPVAPAAVATPVAATMAAAAHTAGIREIVGIDLLLPPERDGCQVPGGGQLTKAAPMQPPAPAAAPH